MWANILQRMFPRTLAGRIVIRKMATCSKRSAGKSSEMKIKSFCVLFPNSFMTISGQWSSSYRIWDWKNGKQCIMDRNRETLLYLAIVFPYGLLLVVRYMWNMTVVFCTIDFQEETICCWWELFSRHQLTFLPLNVLVCFRKETFSCIVFTYF